MEMLDSVASQLVHRLRDAALDNPDIVRYWPTLAKVSRATCGARGGGSVSEDVEQLACGQGAALLGGGRASAHPVYGVDAGNAAPGRAHRYKVGGHHVGGGAQRGQVQAAGVADRSDPAQGPVGRARRQR